MVKYLDGNGDFEYTADKRCKVKILCTGEFHVAYEDHLIGPKSALDRTFEKILEAGEEIQVHCKERYTIGIHPLAQRGEKLSAECLVETIEEGELSMYERLKAEMHQTLSRYAEERGLDPYDPDFDDLEWDEPDTETPLTPYEYQEMQEEEPIPREEPEEAPQEENTTTEPLDPSEPETEPPHGSEVA